MFGTKCATCGGATAIGRDARGEIVRVCVLGKHREPVDARRLVAAGGPPPDPWWT